MIITRITLLIIFFISTATHASNLNISLNEYLDQVRCHHLGLQGARLIAHGARQRVGEGTLLMKPTLFAEGQYLNNSYNPNWSPIPGTNNEIQSYQAGIKETTPYGVEGRLYYSYQHQTTNGLLPLYNQNQVTASSPILELNIPLSRNFAGKETRASARLIDSQACLTHFSENYKMTLLLADAESAYWRLAIARNIVGKQRESLSRADQIKQWIEKKTDRKLAETADLLQAQAAYEAKKLDIQAALNDEVMAERNFNTLRGACATHVSENLCSFAHEGIYHFNIPKSNLRGDVLVAEQQKKIADASARLGIEKNKPDVSLYASYALNGNNPSSNLAVSESFTMNYPSTAIGLRLSVPLDFGQMRRDRSGYRKEMKGADLQYQQKIYDNQRLWEDLLTRFDNANKRLSLARQLSDIQLLKLKAERLRLGNGRTTTYQVLLFEQDFTNAQITQLIIQDEILQLVAQLKTFGVKHESC